MITRNVLSQSIQSLSSNRLRSALTMLGVIWGTASVVFLLGWGRGFVKVMKTETRTVGDGFVILSPKKARSEMSGRRGARQLRFHLEDVDAILKHCESVRYATPVNSLYGIIKHENRLKGGYVYGMNIDAVNIYNLQVDQGRFLQPDDIKYSRRVVVLADDLAKALFPPGFNPIESRVKIRGVSFEVIGVLRRKGDTLIDWGGRDDEKAYIPITSSMKHLSGSETIHEIHVQPMETHASKLCIAEVRATLAKQLHFAPDDEEAIDFIDLSGIITSLDIMSLILAAFITVIGVITLFVGGVGVMNIMLISVTERTREIGVRKAIGAKRRQILGQFLAEAVTITMLSGLIGIGLGIGISLIFAAIPRPAILAAPDISLLTVSASFFVMLAIGLFAGTLPAIRAARLDTVEALRYE